MDELIQTIAVYALPVLFAITLHEAAHAYAAKYFGDATAYVQGRMSMNPAKHIDPFGTIIIPVLLYIVTSGAGPAANFVMALLWMLFAIMLSVTGITEPFFIRMAQAGVLTNLVMFAFNLFPIPPLDGGRILTSLLPNRYAYKFAQIEPYGFFIVMALVMLKVLYFWMIPVMSIAQVLLKLLLSPLTIFLS